jgi:hypothetical protein
MNDAIERSQTHATFVIERTYPVPVEAVWHALSGACQLGDPCWEGISARGLAPQGDGAGACG